SLATSPVTADGTGAGEPDGAGAVGSDPPPPERVVCGAAASPAPESGDAVPPDAAAPSAVAAGSVRPDPAWAADPFDPADPADPAGALGPPGGGGATIDRCSGATCTDANRPEAVTGLISGCASRPARRVSTKVAFVTQAGGGSTAIPRVSPG